LAETSPWLSIIQVVSTLAIVATLVFFIIQVRIMNAQLAAMHLQLNVARESTLAQNTLAVAQYLSQPEIRAGRRYMFRQLSDKPLASWTDDDRKEAERVCSSYDVTGLLVRAGIVDRDVIVNNWGMSLRRLYLIAQPPDCGYAKAIR
jgi:hypothetical protein